MLFNPIITDFVKTSHLFHVIIIKLKRQKHILYSIILPESKKIMSSKINLDRQRHKGAWLNRIQKEVEKFWPPPLSLSNKPLSYVTKVNNIIIQCPLYLTISRFGHTWLYCCIYVSKHILFFNAPGWNLGHLVSVLSVCLFVFLWQKKINKITKTLVLHTCTVYTNFLLDKGHVAKNLKKECLCCFIIFATSLWSKHFNHIKKHRP